MINSNTATHTQDDCVSDVPGSGGEATRRTHPYSARRDAQVDLALLDRWRRLRCAKSFEELVARHTGWVCALARRRVKDRHLAEDVTQAVFLILSKKAGRIGPDTPLSAWLFRVTRFASNDAIKRESRRRKRFERAANLYSEPVHSDSSDPDIDVDECIACLGDVDRQVILLRFYEEKSMAQIGQALGISEHAAKKRVTRALGRLRRIFARRGIRVGSLLALIVMLQQVIISDSASAAALVSVVSKNILIASAPSAPIASLANATLRSLATAHARILAALVGAAVLLCLAVTTLSPVMGQALSPLLDHVRSIFAFESIPLATHDPGKVTSPKIQNAGNPEPVKQIWAGRTGEFAWPLLPGGSGSISLPSIVGTQLSVTVIEDNHGALWYRRIDSELIPPPPQVIDTHSYEQLNPYLGTTYQRALINEVADKLQMFDSTPIATDESWKPADSLELRDRSLISDGLQMQFAEQAMPDSISNPISVPEPAFMGLSGAIVLLLARRRRGSPTAFLKHRAAS